MSAAAENGPPLACGGNVPRALLRCVSSSTTACSAGPSPSSSLHGYVGVAATRYWFVRCRNAPVERPCTRNSRPQSDSAGRGIRHAHRQYLHRDAAERMPLAKRSSRCSPIDSGQRAQPARVARRLSSRCARPNDALSSTADSATTSGDGSRGAGRETSPLRVARSVGNHHA